LSPSRPSSLKLPLSALLLLLVAAPASAAARLEIGGGVERSTDETLDVRVDLTNRGDQAAVPVGIDGELFGHHEKRRLDEGVPPGATRSAVLSFPLADAVPGVHALALVLEYWVSPDPGGAPQVFGQPAYILIALGENPPPALTLRVPEAQMDSLGRLRVGIASRDGAAHRVTLQVRTPRALRVDPVDSTVDVPATGEAVAELKLFRVDAPWQSAQGILVVASATDGPVVKTTAATGVVRVLGDPARMPRLRRGLLVVALLLLVGAIVAEVRRQRA
jgi:hypothetical protein